MRISNHVKPGEVYTTFHSTRVFLNQITTSHRDRYTKTPEYKVTAVQVAPTTGPTAYQREYEAFAEKSRQVVHATVEARR